MGNKTLLVVERMVEATTWAVQRTMFFANMIVLKLLQDGREPPPINRNFLYKCFQYACQATVSAVRAKRPFDYHLSELTKAKRTKANKDRKDRGEAPLKLTADNIDTVELDDEELVDCRERADELVKTKAIEAAILGDCVKDFDAVRAQGGFADELWRPPGAKPKLTQKNVATVGSFQVPGLGDQMEAMIVSEMVPNATTYIATTFVARRQQHLEDAIAKFFKTPRHRSRVVTMLLQVLEDGLPFVPDDIDWAPVMARIRTRELHCSFQVQLGEAYAKGLMESCVELMDRLGRTLPATPANLKEHPHVFMRQMHVIQLARNAALVDIHALGEKDEQDNALEDEVEEMEAAIDYDPRPYRKVFSLLPLRSGQSVFIFLDKKRAASMGIDTSGTRWYDKILDLSLALPAGKLRSVIPESFRTDGVQVKVGLKRPGTTSDLMVKRGFGSLKGRSCAAIELERRGIFELTETTGDSVAIEARSVVGLDPGRKDVYSSVMSSTEVAAGERDWMDSPDRPGRHRACGVGPPQPPDGELRRAVEKCAIPTGSGTGPIVLPDAP
jgi:hypothetical protein